MLLLLSTDPSEEPRMQISDQLRTQMVFGVDVDGLKPDQPVTVDASAWGYPVRSLRDVPAGEYYVQALLVKYETFHRSDGKTVKLPMDQGEGRHWNLTPGNLYSKPVKMTLGKSGAPVKIVLDQEIPPIPDKPDTQFVRHIKIQSDLLTKFWGRPMYISAVVLVPWGFDEHPEAHYPLMLFHDHFVRRHRRLSHRAARSEPEAGLQRPVSSLGVQPHPAGRGLQVLPAMDLAEISALPGGEDPACEPLLRRFVCRELGQPGAVRRRHRN